MIHDPCLKNPLSSAPRATQIDKGNLHFLHASSHLESARSKYLNNEQNIFDTIDFFVFYAFSSPRSPCKGGRTLRSAGGREVKNEKVTFK